MVSGIKKGDTHMIFTIEGQTPGTELPKGHVPDPQAASVPVGFKPTPKHMTAHFTPETARNLKSVTDLTARRHDPNPVLSVLVVMFFIGISVGAVKLTGYLQKLEKNKAHVPARNIPMKVVSSQL
jgi:hypothetical protein